MLVGKPASLLLSLRYKKRWGRIFFPSSSLTYSLVLLPLKPAMDDSYHNHHHSSRQRRPHTQSRQFNRQQTFPPPSDSYLEASYHHYGPPMSDFPRGVGVLPGGTIHHPPRFGIRGGPPPPSSSLSLHHPRMSWPAEGWPVRSPFMGAGGEHHSMNFPGPHESYLPPDFNPQRNNNRAPSGLDVRMNFHSRSDTNYDHHTTMNGSKGELPRDGCGQRISEYSRNEHHPFVNGTQFIGGSSSDVNKSHSENKRMKTSTTQLHLSKRHIPLRPLVNVNKELKLKHSTHISIVTYNLLAQDLIDKNMYLYNQCSPEYLKWDFRKINLLKELIDSDADILCLQEMQEIQYKTWLSPELSKHGYSGIFKKRTGYHLDGCALFYRESKLTLLEWNGLEYQRRIRVLNRENVALLAKFAVTEEGVDSDSAVFCVANTHLLFNPKAGEVKLAQLSYLLAELHKVALKPGTNELTPVLICGDFNSTPQSPLLDFIKSSLLNYSKLSALVISGYFEDRERSRIIPIPLLPEEMNIASNCMYNNRTTTKGDVGVKGKGKVSSDVIIISDDDQDSMKTQQDVKSTSAEHCGQKNAGARPPPVTAHEHSSELSLTDTEGYSNRPMKTTRSVRGSSVRGGSAVVNISDFRSLLGSTSTSKRGRDHSDYLSADEFKSPISGGKSPISGESSVDDFVIYNKVVRVPNLTSGSGAGGHGGGSTNSRESYGEDSAIDSLESSPSSASKTTSSGCNDLFKKCKEISNNHRNKHQTNKTSIITPKGILTHPFKLVSAYPHSRSLPSTVTTYHQRAFETVDYIFYNPVVYQAKGSKKQLSGFNLLGRKVLPSNHTLLDLGPQPHSFLSSDHLLLQAIFQFSW